MKKTWPEVSEGLSAHRQADGSVAIQFTLSPEAWLALISAMGGPLPLPPPPQKRAAMQEPIRSAVLSEFADHPECQLMLKHVFFFQLFPTVRAEFPYEILILPDMAGDLEACRRMHAFSKRRPEVWARIMAVGQPYPYSVKSSLNYFPEPNWADVAPWQALLHKVHQQFLVAWACARADGLVEAYVVGE